MTKEELIQSREYARHEYKVVCENCNKENSLFTQGDDYPEYYTDVLMECECKQMITFNLPVN